MSIYQYYKGINHPMPEEYKGTMKANFWDAEALYAESYRGQDLFELQSFVCAFISKWKPYKYADECLEYLKDSPHLERLRRIYEF